MSVTTRLLRVHALPPATDRPPDSVVLIEDRDGALTIGVLSYAYGTEIRVRLTADGAKAIRRWFREPKTRRK